MILTGLSLRNNLNVTCLIFLSSVCGGSELLERVLSYSYAGLADVHQDVRFDPDHYSRNHGFG